MKMNSTTCGSSATRKFPSLNAPVRPSAPHSGGRGAPAGRQAAAARARLHRQRPGAEERPEVVAPGVNRDVPERVDRPRVFFVCCRCCLSSRGVHAERVGERGQTEAGRWCGRGGSLTQAKPVGRPLPGGTGAPTDTVRHTSQKMAMGMCVSGPAMAITRSSARVRGERSRTSVRQRGRREDTKNE